MPQRPIIQKRLDNSNSIVIDYTTMTNLFQHGNFTLASGKESHFKLECDAITPEEWHSLARIALPILPPFDYVISVPSGGDAWVNIFKHYVQPSAHRILFIDDVWTTGGSMLSTVRHYGTPPWHGIVLFARGPVPDNVTALFHLDKKLQ
jgi:orotate phosphoribosyltransferase